MKYLSSLEAYYVVGGQEDGDDEDTAGREDSSGDGVITFHVGFGAILADGRRI